MKEDILVSLEKDKVLHAAAAIKSNSKDNNRNSLKAPWDMVDMLVLILIHL